MPYWADMDVKFLKIITKEVWIKIMSKLIDLILVKVHNNFDITM